MTTSSLAIDISKLKSDACLVRDAGLPRHRAFPNTPAGFSRLRPWLSKQKVARAHARLEATGTYGEAPATYLHDAGQTVSVVNPARIKAYAQSRLSRVKTDKASPASTRGRPGGSRTARSASSSLMPPRAGARFWIVSCTCQRSGPVTRRAVPRQVSPRM